jgi:acyl-CoA synthetase (NDP forming)
MSHQLNEILNPGSIAVVGASEKTRGGGFLTPLIDLGFKGQIYPVNPNYEEVSGLTCYPSIKDVPGNVDYVISSVPSSVALDLMRDCVEKEVKCVHYFTARFSETGRPADAALEQEILKTAREGGVRIIGPNCMGLYNPKAGIAMNNGMPEESGGVGLASQSGGALMQIVGSAAQRGLRFSKAISYGNAIDLNECDYLEYFTEDPDTSVILMYIEGIKDGARFIPALEKATATKPVVILKGGRSDAGNRATTSHTASLAGSYSVFQGLVHGAGGVTVWDFDELVDMAVAFYFLPSNTSRDLGIMGGSGGSSVNGADIFAEAELNVVDIPRDIRDRLKDEGDPNHDWYNNPIDGSISMGDSSGIERLMEMMAEHDDFQTFISFVPGPRWDGRGGSDFESIMQKSLHYKTDKPVIMLSQGFSRLPDTEEMAELNARIRQQLFDDGVATYPSMTRAAHALNKLIRFYDYRKQWADYH